MFCICSGTFSDIFKDIFWQFWSLHIKKHNVSLWAVYTVYMLENESEITLLCLTLISTISIPSDWTPKYREWWLLKLLNCFIVMDHLNFTKHLFWSLYISNYLHTIYSIGAYTLYFRHCVKESKVKFPILFKKRKSWVLVYFHKLFKMLQCMQSIITAMCYFHIGRMVWFVSL